MSCPAALAAAFSGYILCIFYDGPDICLIRAAKFDKQESSGASNLIYDFDALCNKKLAKFSLTTMGG